MKAEGLSTPDPLAPDDENELMHTLPLNSVAFDDFTKKTEKLQGEQSVDREMVNALTAKGNAFSAMEVE